jgi:hypothetical protein
MEFLERTRFEPEIGDLSMKTFSDYIKINSEFNKIK